MHLSSMNTVHCVLTLSANLVNSSLGEKNDRTSHRYRSPTSEQVTRRRFDSPARTPAAPTLSVHVLAFVSTVNSFSTQPQELFDLVS